VRFNAINTVAFSLTELRSFGVHYHPYAIFIQPCSSLLDLQIRSPLLFWTIILVASQDHAQFAAVYQEVVAEHETLLSPILQRAIQQIETIHSLLLLCMWPIPQSRHFYNPAWNYVGLAMNAAMQLDCHNPLGPASKTDGWKGLGHIAVNELSTEDQSRTWLGCFWVGNVLVLCKRAVGDAHLLIDVVGLPPFTDCPRRCQRSNK
jgi:Fungal specific transcription factor domain